MSTVVSFADWLRNYSSHTYKGTTVDKYEAALKLQKNFITKYVNIIHLFKNYCKKQESPLILLHLLS